MRIGLLGLMGLGLFASCTSAPAVPEPVVRVRPAEPDVCAAHGVLEVVCPKCNPRLAAVFRAKGDWCEEHGFPESFCPICSPEQGGRPLQAIASGDDAPADGTRVRFATREVGQLAGLQTTQATLVSSNEGTPAVARIAWDAMRVALVGARSPGVVVQIRADVGSTVAVGDALALIRSAHVGSDRARLVALQGALGLAEADLARKLSLRDAGVTAARDVLAAEQAVASARGELGARRSELGLVGTGQGDSYTVTSPIAGVVTERHVSVGLSVDATQPLFQVVDAAQMWAELEVAETDLGKVALGQAVEITLDAVPGRQHYGTVDYIAPSVDPKTRTTLARVVLDNADGALRANMYGNARIAGHASEATVAVPKAAVQRAGDVHLVFVREAEDAFVARRVRVLSRSEDLVSISGGVSPGDVVVTTGSFLLKTETLKDSIGAGCCDGD